MKSLLVLALGLIVAVSADAAERRRAAPRSSGYSAPASSGGGGGQRMAGCGLGSTVIESNDTWSQVAAAFLNGTGFQTFAISFGTSNCTEDGVASASREKDAFVEANLAELRHDVAAGQGEYLTTAAGLFGCQAQDFSVDREAFLKADAEEAVQIMEKASCGG